MIDSDSKYCWMFNFMWVLENFLLLLRVYNQIVRVYCFNCLICIIEYDVMVLNVVGNKGLKCKIKIFL